MMKQTVTYEEIQYFIFTVENRHKYPDEYCIVLHTERLLIEKDMLDSIDNPTKRKHFITTMHNTPRNYVTVDLTERPDFLGYPIIIDKSITRPKLVHRASLAGDITE